MNALIRKFQTSLIAILIAVLIQGCDSTESQAAATDAPGSVINNIERKAVRTIGWQELEPADYDPQAVFDRYAPELEAFEDGDLAAVPIYVRSVPPLLVAAPTAKRA